MRRAPLLLLIVCLAALPALATSSPLSGAGSSPESGLCGSDGVPALRGDSSSRRADQAFAALRAAGATTGDPEVVRMLVEVAGGSARRPQRWPARLVLRI